MSQDIHQALSVFIAEKILKQPGRQIKAEEPLISTGLIDSFSLVDLALFVEESYGVRLEDTELNAASFDTLVQLSALIEQRRS
jgi:acyl carrier protein